MIKAIMLIFEPTATWGKIVLAKPSFRQVFFLFLTPLILISVGCEIAALSRWGKHQEYGGNVIPPQNVIIAYGAAQLFASYLLVLLGSKLVKSVADTFHARHAYTLAFTAVAYGLAPFFLFRLLDVFAWMNPWAPFGIGMALSIATMYQGIPRVILPDPPNAFGIYLMSAVMLAGVAALLRFLTLLILTGKVKVF